MKSKSKSKLLLLDANIVIEAYRLGFWRTLYTQFEICLPSIVLQKEVQFFRSQQGLGENTEINLKPLVDAGEIKEISATNEDLYALSQKFKSEFFEILGDGEKEALALLVAGKAPDTRFSTADGPAIKALGALNMSYNGVSFESLLSEIGQSGRVSKLRIHYKKKFFDEQIKNGRTESEIILTKQ